VEPRKQVIEKARFFFGAIFVWRAFFLTGALLSVRIYKICTSLSTGFVENIGAARTTAARKPLPDAPFRGVSTFP
jgi:hypothetical protein